MEYNPQATCNLDGGAFFATNDLEGINLAFLDSSRINIALDSIPNDSETRKIIRNFMSQYKFTIGVGAFAHDVLPQGLLQR